MFKKLTLSAALAAGLMSSAFAAPNGGFESGTTDWNGSAVLTAVPSASVDWLDSDGTTVHTSVITGSGANFGLWQPPGTDGNTQSTQNQQYSLWNFDIAVTAPTDVVWLRLITSDWAYALPCTGALGEDPATCGFNDYVEVYYTTGGGVDRIYASDMTSGDSGWKGFAVPTGTTGLQINVFDYYGQSGPGIINTPTVAIDYGVSVIPEPSTVLMMLAGLGALGLKTRRRNTAKAVGAAVA